MVINGKYVDDRYGIVKPFIEWAEDQIGMYPDFKEALRMTEGKLIEINEKAICDADGNMAAKETAN